MSIDAPGSYSLTRRLLLLLLIPLLLALAFAGWTTVKRTRAEVNQLHDKFLSRSATVFTAFLQYEFAEEIDEADEDDLDDDEAEEDDEGDNGDDSDDDEIAEELLEAVARIEQQQGVSVDYRLSVSGQVVFTSSAVAKLPACADGFNSVQSAPADGTEPTAWRCYGRTHRVPDSRQYYVAEFFETESARTKAIVSLLRSALVPLLAVPVLLLAIAWLAIRRGMREVVAVSDDVETRSLGNLDSIALDRRPTELLPVLQSVNALMRKVKAGIDREKQFTDDAAHELRTPLTSISMSEQLLRRENTRDDIVPLLDQLKTAVDQSQELIDQLLRFARLQSIDELDRQTLNMAELVQEQLNNHASSILQKDLTIDFARQDDVCLPVDKAAMGLAIGNLLSNAVKFSPVGGTIKLQVSQSKFRIEDEGSGIAIEERKVIFERFYRARQVRNTPGAGLGLALVKWVVELHGFTVQSIAPEALVGAAFLITWSNDRQANSKPDQSGR